MQAKFWQFCKKIWGYFWKFILIVIGFKILHKCEYRAWAQGLQYFGQSDLDYWREGKTVKPYLPMQSSPPKSSLSTTENSVPQGSIIRQSDANKFDWKNYENPSSIEFWDDGGDYVAPRPLREAVANPTPENLEKYTQWQAKRLVVIAEFSAKLALQSLQKNSYSHSQKKAGTNSATINQNQKFLAPINFREIQLMYFYQSSCQHCKASILNVEALRKKGVQVSFIQLDSGENQPLHASSLPYSAEFSNQFAITATPTWIFRRRENSIRLQGEQSSQEIQTEIAKLFRPSNVSNSQTLGALP